MLNNLSIIVPGDNSEEERGIELLARLVESPLVPLSEPPAASRHAPSVYLASLASAQSRRTMKAAIVSIAEFFGCDVMTLPWHQLRYEHTAALRAHLLEVNEPATVKKKLSALRGVLKACRRLGQMSGEDFFNATDLDAVRGSTLLAGRLISPAEMRALVDVCAADASLHGVRDAALFGVLFGVGLRRQEVVGLDLDDYTEDDGALFVRHGKGDKQRINYASGGAAEAIEYWIEKRGDERGPLFLPVTKGPKGTIRMRRLSGDAVMAIMRKRARQAGIRHCSPHDTRRTYITSLLASGIDVKTVANMVGHSDIKTTANYDRRGEDAKRRASEAFHFPFVRPDAALPEPTPRGRARRS